MTPGVNMGYVFLKSKLKGRMKLKQFAFQHTELLMTKFRIHDLQYSDH